MQNTHILKFIEVNKFLEFEGHELLCCLRPFMNKNLNFI